MTTAAAPAALHPLRLEPAPAPVPRPVRPGHAAPATTAPHLQLLRYEPAADGPSAVAPPPAPPPPVPDDRRGADDLRRRAHQVLCLVLEVLDGRRSPTHLAAHLDPAALRYVRAASNRRGPTPSRLTSVHLCRPRPGAVEVAAVRRVGGRVRALAARFEGRPDDPARWRCVTVRLL